MVNLEQIKKDRKNGVVVSMATWDALLAYAISMEKRQPCSRDEWNAGRPAAKTCERCGLGGRCTGKASHAG